MLSFRLAECDSQIGSKIVFCPTGCDSITKYFAATATNFAGLFQCASFLDFFAEPLVVLAVRLVQLDASRYRGNIFLKPVQNLFRIAFRPCCDFWRMPLSGDYLKAVLMGELQCVFFCLVGFAGVNTLRQYKTTFLALLSCFSEWYLTIHTKKIIFGLPQNGNESASPYCQSYL